jgi:hypothetical protein
LEQTSGKNPENYDEKRGEVIRVKRARYGVEEIVLPDRTLHQLIPSP